jgi:hypothetical protein
VSGRAAVGLGLAAAVLVAAEVAARAVAIPSGALTRGDGVQSAQYVLVVRAGFDTDIHFVDSAPPPYALAIDRWFLNTDKNVELRIGSGRLPSGASAAASQFQLAAPLKPTFLPYGTLLQSATAGSYFAPGYGIQDGRVLAGMDTLPVGIPTSSIYTVMTQASIAPEVVDTTGAFISGTTMTSTLTTFVPGMLLTGTGVVAGTYIVSGSSTTWTVSVSQTVGTSGSRITITGAATLTTGDVGAASPEANFVPGMS